MERLQGTRSELQSLRGSLSSPNGLRGTVVMKNEGAPYSYYTGDTEITPTSSDQLLDTSHKVVTDDILVKKIPTYMTSNEFGVTFIIAS